MRRYEIPSHVKHRYRLARPYGKSRVFRIQKFKEDKTIEAIKNESLDAINSAYTGGRITRHVAEKECSKLVDSLYRADGALIFKEVSNVDNTNLIERYFQTKIRPNKKVKAKDVAWSRLRLAVECLGPISLLSGTEAEIQEAVDSRELPANTQRRRIATLKQLLKWSGRTEVELHADSEESYDMIYISPTEFTQSLNYLPTEAIRCAAEMAYNTGCRIGELLALEPHNMRADGVIHVSRQLLRTGKLGSLKSQNASFSKDVFALKRAVELYPRWMLLKNEVTHAQRVDLANIMRRACVEAKVTSVKFHQLRHGYAITLASMGMTLSEIASSMGIREETAKNHYLGYIQTTAMSARLRAMESEFEKMQESTKEVGNVG